MSDMASWRRGVCCALLVCAGRAAAQVDPSGTWRTLHTPHFRIHFRPDDRDVARRAAREAERAYALLAAELPRPRGAVDLTLGDDIDASNGFASVAPSNRITVLLAPPADDPALQDNDDWLRLVIVHELAHIFHLDRTRGFWRVLQRVFGRAPGVFPNAYQPSWVIEGFATYYETKFTTAGRADGSFHTQLLAADAGAGATRAPGDALRFSRWPTGFVPYAYGSRFFHAVARTAGDSLIPRFAEATAGQLIPYRVGRQLRRVGASADLRRDWNGATRLPPAPPPAAGSVPMVSSRRIAWGLRAQPVPRVAPDGRAVAYVRDDGTGAPRLVVADVADGRIHRSHRVTGAVSYDWQGDSLLVTQLEFTSRFRIRSDRYVWLPGGAWRRVTRGARLTAPRAGGGLLAEVVIGAADNTPVVAGARVHDAPGAVWGAVVPSPDGRWIAATRQLGGRWALVRWPRAAPESVGVIAAARDGGPIADPSWAPDGALLYVADQDGFPQVHRWTDSTGGVLVTAAPLGARSPAMLPDGSLLYTTLAASGWELRSTPVLPVAGAAPMSATAAQPLDTAGEVALRETGYRGWPSLRPHFWIPVAVDAGPTGLFFGGLTSGSDALARTGYVVEGLVAPGSRRVKGSAAVVSHALGNPSLDLWAANDWSYLGTDSTGHVVSVQDLDAAVGATFVARRWRTIGSLRVAGEYEGVRFAADPDTALAAICVGCAARDQVGGSVTLALAHSVGAPLAVSPLDGFAASATYRRREAQGSGAWSDEVRARLALYAGLPWRVGFARPVLALRVSAGATQGPLGERFSVGGVATGTLDLGLGGGVSLGAARAFPVRGFGAGALAGRRAATASAELRLPLALVSRALGALPVGADKLSLALFGDVGGAWDPGAPRRLTRLRAAGVELVGDLTVNYDLPLRLRAGLAQPLADPPAGGPRRPHAYLALGADF